MPDKENLLQKSHRISQWKQGERFTYDHVMDLHSVPEVIFPLLCPILEYKWLKGWECTMVYSDSGIAENNCIFYKSPAPPLYEKLIFQVIDYQPPKAIEFLIFINNTGSIRFRISLKQDGENRTQASWNYTITGHSKEGNKQLKEYRENIIETQVGNIEKDLAYWLGHNKMRP